jgi:hypothetical protein
LEAYKEGMKQMDVIDTAYKQALAELDPSDPMYEFNL